MNQCQPGRRSFLRNSTLALTVPTIARDILAQSVLQKRVEWKDFRTTPQYDALLTTVKAMKANTNEADPASWTYWVNIHLNHCPHGVPYFLAWHRGYLYYFEKQLRTLSGDPKLVLPYWDYYSYSTMPAEFTNTNSPLYVPRVNVNVYQALSMAPFSSTLTNFPEGSNNAFEPSLETAPHNQLHNIVGNVMATLHSPVDPIFWLHHGNIDRLWVAWVAARNGRKMPWGSYWSGYHVYTDLLTMQKRLTYDTRNYLLYYYQTETFPTSMPLAEAPKRSNILRVQATSDNVIRNTPATGSFKLSSPRQIDSKTFSIGGALNIGLDRRSISAQIPIPSVYWQAMQGILAGRPSGLPGTANKSYKSAHVKLDAVELAEAGKNGGYYYQVYLNLPSSGEVPSGQQVLLGGLGPFEINAAAHHGQAHIKYRIDGKLLGQTELRSGLVTVSFVRVDGDNSPDGMAIGIGEARLELSTE